MRRKSRYEETHAYTAEIIFQRGNLYGHWALSSKLELEPKGCFQKYGNFTCSFHAFGKRNILTWMYDHNIAFWSPKFLSCLDILGTARNHSSVWKIDASEIEKIKVHPNTVINLGGLIYLPWVFTRKLWDNDWGSSITGLVKGGCHFWWPTRWRSSSSEGGSIENRSFYCVNLDPWNV